MGLGTLYSTPPSLSIPCSVSPFVYSHLSQVRGHVIHPSHFLVFLFVLLHLQTCLCNKDAVCFLWGRNWISYTQLNVSEWLEVNSMWWLIKKGFVTRSSRALCVPSPKPLRLHDGLSVNVTLMQNVERFLIIAWCAGSPRGCGNFSDSRGMHVIYLESFRRFQKCSLTRSRPSAIWRSGVW